jgi:hypothetical protein
MAAAKSIVVTETDTYMGEQDVDCACLCTRVYTVTSSHCYMEKHYQRDTICDPQKISYSDSTRETFRKQLDGYRQAGSRLRKTVVGAQSPSKMLL